MIHASAPLPETHHISQNTGQKEKGERLPEHIEYQHPEVFNAMRRGQTVRVKRVFVRDACFCIENPGCMIFMCDGYEPPFLSVRCSVIYDSDSLSEARCISFIRILIFYMLRQPPPVVLQLRQQATYIESLFQIIAHCLQRILL